MERTKKPEKNAHHTHRKLKIKTITHNPRSNSNSGLSVCASFYCVRILLLGTKKLKRDVFRVAFSCNLCLLISMNVKSVFIFIFFLFTFVLNPKALRSFECNCYGVDYFVIIKSSIGLDEIYRYSCQHFVSDIHRMIFFFLSCFHFISVDCCVSMCSIYNLWFVCVYFTIHMFSPTFL